jgi:PAS domain S-box-containing protein
VVHVLISTVGVDPENKSGIAFLMDVTELKNKEEALHKSEQRLRFHLENSPLAVVEWNSDLFVTQWSSEAERIFGWKKEETLNRHIGTLNVIYPEDIPIVDQTITRLTSGQDLTVVASNRNVTKAGKIIECIWHNSVLLDEKGQMKSVMSLVEDITERKKAEVALRESEERFRALAENIPDLIVRFDRDLRLVYSNPAALKRTGFSMGKVVGHKARTGDAPVVIAEWEKAAREVLDIGISRRTEFTTQYLGETRVFDVQIIPEKDAEGAVRSIVAFGRDITERKKMEESLQESEEKFRKMIWDMEVGVLLQGPKAEILVSNPKALDLLGLTENQLMGKTSFDPDWNVIHEDGSSFPGSTHPVPLSIATRLPVRDVVMGVYRPAKRDRAWLVVSAEPQLNADGTIRQVVCTFVDITRLKQAEDELKHLNEVLEDRIKMRTSELVKANTALQQAEAKYRTVADYAYNWEYWINPEGTYNYVSPSCERITGYSAQEFMDDKNLIYKIVHPDDLGNFTDRVAQQLHSNEPCEMEFRIVSKTGDIRWIGHSRRNIYDDRKYLGIRVSNLDITEKVKAENELLNVTVEVEERERNRFSRELHDGLGPLLSTVKLYFQWLAETDDVDKIKIITEKGNFNIDQAIQTTREVAHGLSPLILNNFGYIEAVLGFIHSINETQKINIYFIFNSSERFGIQVETILYRITTELVNNTLKHAKATYAKILFRKQEEKNVITFTYSDNGIGFDPQEVEKTGKGLGLNNIKNRIKTLMGIMSIETIMGEGMKVQIELPVHESFN